VIVTILPLTVMQLWLFWTRRTPNARPPGHDSRSPECVEMRLQLAFDAVEQVPDMVVVLL
jgi:hypothetical protein